MITDKEKRSSGNIKMQKAEIATPAFENKVKPLFDSLYQYHSNKEAAWNKIKDLVNNAAANRQAALIQKDSSKNEGWFLSNKISGMSLYADRFCENLSTLKDKLSYFEDLGINFLHLMPLFESPENESDGGYAVSDFRKVDKKFGTLDELKALINAMNEKSMYLMLDIVLNHTSHKHEWAEKAKQGIQQYQDYFYMFNIKEETLVYEQSMPEVFPEAAPGNFTWIPECNKWVMTVFHNYQWDLNYKNPMLFAEMLDTIFFYANLGVDILRIDAPAFVWKQPGTACQNLPEAHTILRLIKQCVKAATPGMALLAEAIVAPKEIMKYFGTDDYYANECDVAYNATHMALQWDALATGDIRVMMNAQHDIMQKPIGTTWINYTRCHDDIGLAYEDAAIEKAGYNPWHHRKFLKDYYSGSFEGSYAAGALFSVNEKTGDARISGSFASLCGLEKAIVENNATQIGLAEKRILLMQAHSLFLGGIPMLFYGDEKATINDYSYLQDPGKDYDNRWMHRPVIKWKAKIHPSQDEVYKQTKHLLELRQKHKVVSDTKRISWIDTQNNHVAGYIHQQTNDKLLCFFNFSALETSFSWYVVKNMGSTFNSKLIDIYTGNEYTAGRDDEKIILQPYQFVLLKTV